MGDSRIPTSGGVSRWPVPLSRLWDAVRSRHHDQEPPVANIRSFLLLGGRPRTMTAQKLEAAHQLRSQGKTLKETAGTLGVSVSSLTRALSSKQAAATV